MSVIVSFDDYTPVIRYDETPWTQALIDESLDGAEPWTNIDTITFSVPDADPANPVPRSFTTQQGTAVELWYRVTFRDQAGNLSLPTVALQNTATARQVYATTSELALILHVREADNHVALQRVLIAASTEIDSELGRDAPFSLVPSLAQEVTLERAVEHWQQMKSPFGILGLGAEAGATYTAHDSWDRHAHKLAPLKASWGFA